MLKDMARPWLLLSFALAFVAYSAHAAIVEHTFNVGNFSISQLCRPARVITAVNGQLPGPTLHVREGDTVVIHVINDSPYNITVHWHGIFQRGTPWADGPEMVTQCPIRPGHSYTYRFNVTAQEGTLWWHAHSSLLRATVHGALVIQPRRGERGYPFPKPDKEEIILLGEWWNDDVVNLGRLSFLTGILVRPADAYTINGKPGDLYNCSNSNQTYKLKVKRNSTYLLRIINAALNTPFFFRVAGHTFTVVAADASYTMPYKTDVIVIAPGQTVDALMVADAPPASRYYMAASPYESAIPRPPFSDTTATAVVEYIGTPKTTRAPLLPRRPNLGDTVTAHRFLSNLTALILSGRPTVPLAVDTRMFVTFGLGISDCRPAQTFCKRNQPVFAASMNNASFELPTTIPLLEAQFKNVAGVYTRDFPDKPPMPFNYTHPGSKPQFTTKSTKVKTVRYNTAVEVVLQNTALVPRESHPMHLHGFNFFVLAQGFGNYDEAMAVKQYNLVNPQLRNTVAVPAGGWAVIRFVANNPGMWFMHCHFDAHLPIGLAMVFEVKSGSTPETTLPPPPADLPKC